MHQPRPRVRALSALPSRPLELPRPTPAKILTSCLRVVALRVRLARLELACRVARSRQLGAAWLYHTLTSPRIEVTLHRWLDEAFGAYLLASAEAAKGREEWGR